MSLTLLEPHIKDIGDFEVRRLLPAKRQRAVGPFVFWDHFGPVVLAKGSHMDVRPHPHIGLATLTWLFEGEIMHRDSLGNVQNIRPGQVNWMTAGRGIVHSERTPDERRGQENPLHGLQIWLGLPDGSEDTAPDFQHYPAEAIPRVPLGEVTFELIAGKALGATSPVTVYSPLCYLTAEFSPGQAVDWPRQFPEEAIYLVSGDLEIDGEGVPEHQMAVLPEGESVRLGSPGGARIALLGGEPIGERHLVWNFVASDRARIREAAERWKAGGFDRVPGDDEFIPWPDHLAT
ncbi:MAG: pirin family protein [Xanthomonadales bacterium]|jgi:redox-sensitive bicupin YhaK (pirin superfamily)|nr:pirin family protein [Xanthomonadales bacterium]